MFLLCGPQNIFAHGLAYNTSGLKEAGNFQNTLISLRDAHRDLDEITITPTGEWIIVEGEDVYHSSGFSSTALSWVEQYIASGRKINAIAFDSNGHWVIAAEDYLRVSGGIQYQSDLVDRVKFRQKAGYWINEIAFANDGHWSIYSDATQDKVTIPGLSHAKMFPFGYYYSSGNSSPQKSLSAAVEDRKRSRRKISTFALGDNGRWILEADQWFASHGVSDVLVNRLEAWQRDNRRIDRVTLGPGNSYVIYGVKVAPDLNDKMTYIEQKLGPSKNENIFKRMHDLNIPGLSLALIDKNKVIYARGYGKIKSGDQRAVMTTTPFATASLSKYIAGMVTLKMAGEGYFDLYNSIASVAYSAANEPLNWYQVDDYGEYGPMNDWLKAVNQKGDVFGIADFNPNAPDNQLMSDIGKVEIRHLLTHTANFKHSSTYYEASDLHNNINLGDEWWNFESDRDFCLADNDIDSFNTSPETTGVTTLDLLLGYRCSGSTCDCGNKNSVWFRDNDLDPGEEFFYSNEGYIMLQAVLETVSGELYEDLVQELVFDPLKMADSFVRQPTISDSYAASFHNVSGEVNPREYRRDYTGAGVYASAYDYAQAMVVALNKGEGSMQVGSPKIMSNFEASDFFDNIVPGANFAQLPGTADYYTAGIKIEDVSFSTDMKYHKIFRHGGWLNRGARSCMVGVPDAGQGLVILTNRDTSIELQGLLNDILQAYNQAFGTAWTFNACG